METKINIAEILKDKPEGMKLWTDMFGSVTLYCVTDACDAFQVKHHHNKEPWFDENGKMCKEGVLCIYPSKSMRDWSKFAWKKGDVLIRTNSEYCIGIFDKWTSDDYSTFSAKYINLGLSDNFSCSYTCKTEEWEKTENSKIYISEIERVMNGKLNLQTLKIQTQPEFKDGDFITAAFTDGDEMICVFKEKIEQDYMGYCGFFSKGKHEGDAIMDLGDDCICNDSPICKEIRLATEEEKQQLFEALAKEGKVWDAEKKAIVDLKPKCEFKPFDRCIWKIRNCEGSIWQASFVSYVDEYGAIPMGVSIDKDLVNLIILPYNDQTKLLVGTTDEWKG